MFDMFQGGRVRRRCRVTVTVNLDNLDSGRLCLQQCAGWELLSF